MLSEELKQFVQTQRNVSIEFVERAREYGQGVYLYGAGATLGTSVQFMRKYGIPVKAILNTNPLRHRNDYCGIPIISFAEFMKSKPSPNSWFVISAPLYAGEIMKKLSDFFPKENIFVLELSLYVDFIPNISKYRNYLVEHWQELSEFSDCLSDDTSQKTLEFVLRGRISGDLRYFRECSVPDQYYPADIIHFTDNEVMVELGANNGKTLLDFIRRCPNFKVAYCFEPDKVCIPLLDEIKENVHGGVIHIVPKGAWDCSTVLEFCSDGEGTGDAHIQSGLSSESMFQIETAAVDEKVHEPITFLKMDIEGAEMRALHGAQKQITENHPKLAVCVYHRITDILDVWNYLRELVPEYRFYLRHHAAHVGEETVLYAVVGDAEKQ